MIEKICLSHFKCFELLNLPLAQLTLLSGTNASGKSTILQALALLHQTMREQEWSSQLMLNGNTLKLGTVQDVVDQVYGRNSFNMTLYAGGHKLEWSFSGERSFMSMAIDYIYLDNIKTSLPFSVHSDNLQVSQPSRLRYLLPVDLLQLMFTDNLDLPYNKLAYRLRDITYMTAERIGPREFYPVEERQTSYIVGPTGEQAISLLYTGRDNPVLDGLQIEGVPPRRFQQVEARMGKFFPGFGMTLDKVPRMNAVTLGLRTSEDTDYHRPVNVGFGLTQILPIVIAALSADRDDILLIENPEVHLHPSGQMLMGQFLAEVAGAGIQVIVETHSDHILNGIRRAVKAGGVTPEQVALHFFRPRVKGETQVFSPQLDKLGNIDNWPEGFFDQFDKDMNYLAGWGN